MHEHISNRHPDLLDCFVEGWQALSPKLQSAFQDPPDSTQAMPGGMPHPQYPPYPPGYYFQGFQQLMPPIPVPAVAIMSQGLPSTRLQSAAPRQPSRRRRGAASYRAPTMMPIQYPLTWLSWANFVSQHLPTRMFPHHAGVHFLDEKMEHAGSMFGLPATPDRYNEYFMGVPGSWNMSYKTTVVERAFTDLLERAKYEAWFRIKSKIEEEGVSALMPWLEGKPIFGEDIGDIAELFTSNNNDGSITGPVTG